MTETIFNPEIQEVLPKAVREVAVMYLDDQLGDLLGTQSPEQRDQFWRQTAEEFGPFSEEIAGLREAVKTANVTKKAYSEPVARIMGLHFSAVGDDAAKQLLTDILFARTAATPGYMDYKIKPIDEAKAMAIEIGANGDLRGDEMRKLDLDGVIQKVLTGGLKLTRQS